MGFVPQGIFRDIVRRVGKHGFRELVGFIGSGKEGKKAVYDPAVLVDVDLDEFIFVSSLADEESMYHNFFFKCFEAGNITAQYVERLRVAVKYGPSPVSLELMKSLEETIVYAKFVVGVFSICSGRFEEGKETLHLLYQQVSYLSEVVEIAETVMTQIAEIRTQLAGNYNNTYGYNHFEIPECVFYGCCLNDVCFDCLAYWYSGQIRDLC